ncbi:glycosyltransferase family 2 protein [Pasteurellaceae bacterium LIM206]|nr:glycosyltransferase family 2 protein [Pasteurellaceae bacterium LIM206]
MNIVVVIPYYNHPATIADVVHRVLNQGLDCLIIDDGSDEVAKLALEPLKQIEQVKVYHRIQNGGKGAAVKTGFQQALALGYSHVLQVDADAQHQLEDCSKFVEYAKRYPLDLICGQPIYAEDAPKARLYGRKITNFWIAINTLSLSIPDGMCGFRLYPLSALQKLKLNQVGDFMDFDVEILVRLYWQKIRFHWIATPIKYQPEGVSHFRGWKDNLLISKMHARLFFTMLAYQIKRFFV